MENKYEFKFVMPYSMAILIMVANDKRLINAHDKAIVTAIENIKMFSEGCKDIDINSIETYDSDPKLSIYTVVNVDIKCTNGVFHDNCDEDFVENVIYLSNLALNIKEVGYEIIVNSEKGTFEIKGVEQDLIDKIKNRQ